MAQGILQEITYQPDVAIAGSGAKQGKAAEIWCSSLSHSPQRALFNGKAPENLVLQRRVGGTATESSPTATESRGYCNRKPRVLQRKVSGYRQRAVQSSAPPARRRHLLRGR